MSVALLLVALLWLLLRARVALAVSRIPPLQLVQADAGGAPLPPVSIVSAARDEERDVEEATRSFLAQRVPSLQVIVVDDRSTDATPAILAGIAQEDPRLLVVRIESKPDGWLGKCWALSQGAARATGDFVLFTDGDVKLHPDCLARALAYCERASVDHLSLLPHMEADSYWHESLHAHFVHVFVAMLAGARPNEEGSEASVGVGAFGLVRRSAFDAVSGMEELKLQVGEDVALARLLVRNGYRHRILAGDSWARLHWQQGVRGTIRGLEKNTFWGLRFSRVALVAITLLTVFELAPALGFLAGTATGVAASVVWLLAVALPYVALQRTRGFGLAAIPAHPVSAILLQVTAWSSAMATLRQGGIRWRGDFFSMEELRAALKPLSWWRGRIRERAP